MASVKKPSDDQAVEGSKPKRAKAECTYGERCYRKKLEHFEQLAHPHLDNLLEIIGDGELHVPSYYTPQVSKETLLEQLAFHRRMKYQSKSSTCRINTELDDSVRGSASGSANNNGGGSGGAYLDGNCKNKGSRESENSGISSVGNGGICGAGKNGRRSGNNTSPGNGDHDGGKTNIPLQLQSGAIPKPDEESSKKDNKKRDDNLQQMNMFRVVSWDRRKMKVTKKLESASPYNFFLTTVTDSKPTHSESLSISFPELLDPILGDLECSLQVNFMVEFGWLLAQYHITDNSCKPLTLLYGEVDMELSDQFKHFLTHVKVVPPSPFGSHHTKIMVFAYEDKSMRVVVSTANLVESDWHNRTQGLWMSDRLPQLEDSADTASGDSPTNFKRDLIRYLSAYRLPELTSWIGRLKRADMSKVNVFFIASVPGKHGGASLTHWGQLALKRILIDHHTIPKGAETYPVIAQASSIGSLGPKPESWLLGDMLRTLSGGKRVQPGPVSMPVVKFMYPSFENIANSYDGLLGGGCLPYSRKTHSKQEWLTSFMCQWYSDYRNRTRAPPHIKTYCRVSPDMSRLSYFLLTSANLSKAAWGNITSAGASTNILSYEAGVLFLPEFITGEDFFPLKKMEGCEHPVFPMPYDLPTKPFSFSDVPWFIENLI